VTDQERSIADQLKEIELAKAKVELQLKQQQLERKPKWWAQVLSSPAFLAAVVTACITGAITYNSDRQATQQREAEAHRAEQQRAVDAQKAELDKKAEQLRYEHETNKSILLGILNPGDSAAIASRLKLFLDTKILDDPNSNFAKTLKDLQAEPRRAVLSNLLNAANDIPLDFGSGVNLEPLGRPISLRTLNSFIRQGYPRELLFWLFTDSFTLNDHGAYGYHYAPPDDFGCSREDSKHRCFVDWVRDATLAGLTVEEKSVQRAASANAGSGSEDPQTTIYARFCFSQVLALQAAVLVPPSELLRNKADSFVHAADLFASNLACDEKGNWDPLASQDLPLPAILPLVFARQNVIFSIVPRSTYGVFEFLGKLIKMQRVELAAKTAGHPLLIPAYIPPDRQYAQEQPILITVREDPKLLQVLRDDRDDDCFVETKFRNERFCVPQEAATTKRIIAFLTQLIAVTRKGS
jgi:hypothetical protein